MVHVSEYGVGKKPKPKVKSNVILRVFCKKCGKSHDQQDVGAFMQDWVCADCKAAKDYDKFRERLKSR
ncbi:MAG: hypothetical protein ACYSUC_08555 [Planctomycetota bacterium]